ncbi:MAG TPA: ATP-dependent DNA helicase [Candidatus Saccharimonadales bacterium]|nr:ATP-dependent DNA helicase [Candidatus Saccharimonadales bacterium]
MGRYEEALAGLNDAQKKAVTTIDGPVLVIAGPGTGKTQLLTTRIAHILATTDTLPENILCLTFTESGATTMRQRLAGMIGQAAYNITISTYHAFGSDLLRRYPDYFTDLGDQQPADDLSIDAIFRQIVADLPYGNPLKFADTYLGDIKTFVSDAKRALLSPDDIRTVAKSNADFTLQAQPLVRHSLETLVAMRKFSDAYPKFEALLHALEPLSVAMPLEQVAPLSSMVLTTLREALEQAETSGKLLALTKWKNTWLAKDDTGAFVLDGQKTTQKLRAAADIYEKYLHELAARNLFDYDDMILRAVRGLEANDDLRFTLQERYLYILLDEFQDTNGAQLRLVELLTNNPVLEGRPNVLAVGDDDQAIYAFQGADYSHMLQFRDLYRNVVPVALTKNYRSHAHILQAARGIAEQIEERLHHHFPEIEKTLEAANTKLQKTATIERHEAKSDVGQFAWTAHKIAELIKSGVQPSEIAVLAPQHKYLEPLVPYLQEASVPVRYEKRENVLDDPAIQQLLTMSQLVQALGKGDFASANALWAEVLSFSFWGLSTSVLWQLSWQANDERENWTETLLTHDQLKPIALFFMRLSMLAGTETLETVLDYIVGVTPLDLSEPGFSTFRSPFYSHYFHENPDNLENVGSFWDLLTNLTILRARLREYKADQSELLILADFVDFVAAHRAANIKIVNTSPYQEADEAVQLMTAFKSKGMEFDAVFVLAVNDEAWGTGARGQSSRLSLPPNLQFIRYAGATNDERLRLFYVAVTRAKIRLFLLNYQSTYSGKALSRLRYLNETNEGKQGISPLLPEGAQTILPAEGNALQNPQNDLAAYWQQRHHRALTREDARALLQPRLDQFQLSPTHVNSFVDLEYAGPTSFFINTILRFPKAPTATGQFGNAIHETLEWIHVYHKKQGSVPDIRRVLATFEQRLRMKRLSAQDTAQMLDRGQTCLRAYLAQRQHTIAVVNECEISFRREGIFIGDAHMAGNIDKLIINPQSKTITIVDYKTGSSYNRWQHTTKLHKYKQQLYLYRALIEGSRRFAGYTVADAYLEFVEPNEAGDIVELHLTFDADEYQQIKQLAQAVWHRVMCVDLPDVTGFSADMKGIEQFEHLLLSVPPSSVPESTFSQASLGL